MVVLSFELCTNQSCFVFVSVFADKQFDFFHCELVASELSSVLKGNKIRLLVCIVLGSTTIELTKLKSSVFLYSTFLEKFCVLTSHCISRNWKFQNKTVDFRSK